MSELSRAVPHVLRHEPWVYELELDDQGWVSVEDLVAALRVEPVWRSRTVADVEAMVAGASRQRREIREGRIRALYGHSVSGRIERTPADPPRWLFHGTSLSAAEVILVDGLCPMRRQFVHLSVDRETARLVGARKAREPVILREAASSAAEEGVAFYAGNEKVWLADFVPPEFVATATSSCSRPVHRTDGYAEQRGVEAVLYNQYPEAQVTNGGYNKQRAISPLNPRRSAYQRAAADFFARMGEGG